MSDRFERKMPNGTKLGSGSEGEKYLEKDGKPEPNKTKAMRQEKLQIKAENRKRTPLGLLVQMVQTAAKASGWGTV